MIVKNLSAIAYRFILMYLIIGRWSRHQLEVDREPVLERSPLTPQVC